MNLKWNWVPTLTLVLCALITTGLVVRREFAAPKAASRQLPTAEPEFIKNWQSALVRGVKLGSPSAPIQLIEFADFECPYCGSFHGTLRALRERYPTQVTLTYVHFPLPMHRFALSASRVAECAGEQGRFEAMYDQLFDGQASLGVKPWSDYAIAAGVPNLSSFDLCIKKTAIVPRIEEGQQLGAQLDVKATPTLIVNGWKLGRPPSLDELDAMVKAVLAGKSLVTAMPHKS
jgi:protein-disulfide isomerase